MIKKFIKSVCYRLYQIGYYENLRLENHRKAQTLAERATIDPSVWLSDGAEIHNNSQPASKITVGAGSRIMGQLFVFDQDGEISIGSDCFIGPSTRIWSAKRIKIGYRVLIAHNVNIHDNISHPLDAKLRYEENAMFVKTGVHGNYDIKPDEITIGDDAWIGFNCSIMRGVKIGEGAIIGANSVVTKDVAPWTVNVGNPLRCVRVLEQSSIPTP